MLALLGKAHFTETAARLRAAGEVSALRNTVDVRVQGKALQEGQAQQEMQLHWLPLRASAGFEVVLPQPADRIATRNRTEESSVSGRVTRYGYLKPRILAGNLPPWLARHPRQAYIVRAAMATPEWRNRDAIRCLEQRADELTRLTGVAWVLDHDIPLNHPTVCGLTVHNNLKIITHERNKQKSNSLNAEMFDQPEQMRLI